MLIEIRILNDYIFFKIISVVVLQITHSQFTDYPRPVCGVRSEWTTKLELEFEHEN